MLFDVVGTRLNNTDKAKMLNVVRTILLGITQPETPQTCCKLWTLPACCKLSSSCSKPVDFIQLQQVCDYQTCCKLIFADLLQIDICRLAASCYNNLQQACMWISSLDKSVVQQLAASRLNASMLMQVAKIRLAAS